MLSLESNARLWRTSWLAPRRRSCIDSRDDARATTARARAETGADAAADTNARAITRATADQSDSSIRAALGFGDERR